MGRKKILLIGGSLNQTTIMHAIGRELESEYDCFYSPYYGDGFIHWCAQRGLADWNTLGGRFKEQTEAYIEDQRLNRDYRGQKHPYDLVLTGSDLIVPKNTRKTKLILVQEGMTDPETIMFHLVKLLKLPRYFASTSTNGLSDQYNYFCVASEGYKELFIRKGVRPEKIIVTGIPNFDDVAQFCQNDFPHREFALIATSDARETFKIDRRIRFLKRALKLAEGRRVIVKLHPNEKRERAIREIKSVIPEALIFTEGAIEPMIANCHTLICQYSSVAYVGLTLGKTVHSYFDESFLRALQPIQNRGTSAQNIAEACRNLLENRPIFNSPKPNHEDRYRHSGPHELYPITE